MAKARIEQTDPFDGLSIEQLREKIPALRADIKKVEDDVRDFKKELSTLQGRRQIMKAELDRVADAAALDQDYQKILASLPGHNKRMSALNEQIDGVLIKIQIAQRFIRRKQVEVSGIEKKMSELAMGDKAGALRDQFISFKDSVNKVRKDFNKLSEDARGFFLAATIEGVKWPLFFQHGAKLAQVDLLKWLDNRGFDAELTVAIRRLLNVEEPEPGRHRGPRILQEEYGVDHGLRPAEVAEPQLQVTEEPSSDNFNPWVD